MVNDYSPADLSAITGNNNDGFGGGNGLWWLIVLFLFAMCGGWGNGFGGFGNGGGVQDAYVLNSDFSQLSRQLDTATDRLASQGVQISNGLCDGFYTQAQLVNGVNTNILQSANALSSQLASCCCDVRDGISGVNYNMAMNSNALQNAMQTGFCQTNFNGQTNTRDIIESQNANTRAILDAIESNKVEALKDRIAEQNQQINALQLASSQERQNAYLIDQLGYHCPVSAYVVQPPQTISFPNTCGVANYNGGCGCNC